ncbi:MAG: phosphotransferase family protein [Pseudomonadales bacterium]
MSTGSNTSMPGLDAELTSFVTAHAGAIRSASRADSGASRITWLLDCERMPCVLRVDPGDGPVAGTTLNLAREAVAYRALADRNVRIPRLHGEHPRALLMERAGGEARLDALDDAVRIAVMDDYVDALAELHRVRVDSAFDALEPPSTPAAAAHQVVGLWADILRTRVTRPSPLAALAIRWLHRLAPDSAERLVVCHGDVGPGNFMHDGARVTAMLDWEFVHVGDPMDDLAWLAFRGHHFSGGLGDFEHQLARWEKQTGYAVDRRRIAYYRIVVMTIWLVSCLAALDNGARNQDRFTYLNLIDLLGAILPRAMLEYEHREVPDLPVSLQPRESELTENLRALFDLQQLRLREDDPVRFQLALMTSQVLELARVGEDISRQNAEAVSSLTGMRADARDYPLVLQRWIETESGDETRALQVIMANGLRRVQANPAVLPVSQKPFLPLE